MKKRQYDIVILGAGLTGLTLAHYLKNSGKSVLILEKKGRPGGVINTRHENGFIYEEGPNTGVIKYGEVAELFDELEDCEVYIPDNSVKKRYIWKNGRWEKLPSGLAGGIRTPLFTARDKFRILGEPFRKPGNNPEETLDSMVKRRLGKSFLNYAVDPFILGVYAGDPSMIVPRYALPKLYYLEQDYGSFIGGAIKKKFEEKDEMEKKATKDVFSVYGGLRNMIDALYKSIGEDHFVFNAEETKVKPADNKLYTIQYNKGDYKGLLEASNVVSTVGAYEIPYIMPFLREKEMQALSDLKYAKVVQAAVGFKNWNGPALQGFGGLVPHREKRDILGALFMSSFLPERAPTGGQLFAVFLGGVRREEMYEKSDRELTQILEKEMKEMFGMKYFNPDLLQFNRYYHAIPQYGKESLKRFNTIDEIENQYNGLIIGGNLRDGIGMADRIKQAANIAARLKNQS
jgi:oxygen-dependent protoporphyrinogen oxidase